MVGKSTWVKTSPIFPKITGYPVLPDHYEPGPHFEYKFLQIPPGSGPETIETDVIIVGSGPGGGVCAKNLAEAGHRVLVVDKGYYFAPSQLPMTEEAASIHMMDNGGVQPSDDNSVIILSGNTWGGGGTINCKYFRYDMPTEFDPNY